MPTPALRSAARSRRVGGQARDSLARRSSNRASHIDTPQRLMPTQALTSAWPQGAAASRAILYGRHRAREAEEDLWRRRFRTRARQGHGKGTAAVEYTLNLH